MKKVYVRGAGGLVLAAALQATAQTQAPAAADAGSNTATQAIPLPPAEQQSTAAPSGNTSPATAAKLDEVIVTATKHAQVARDIPSSVAVLQGDKLEKLGARKLSDFIELVPGINMQDEIAGEQRKLSVRGVGPDNTTNQTVGTVMGDIALSDPYGALTIVDPDPWDMRTVEVLKGPQGTLFGATSLGGLLRYVPNAPDLGQWEGKAFAEYVSIKDGGADPTFGAALNIPVGKDLAFRASGAWNHEPGYVTIDTPGRYAKNADAEYDLSGRVMALWQPLPRFTATAMYMQELRRSNELNYVNNQSGVLVRTDAPEPSPVDNGFHLSTLDLRYAFDWSTLVSVTGYQTKTSYNNVDTSYLVEPLAQAGISYLHAIRTVSTKGLQQELRLISPDRGWPLSWVGGLYFSNYLADEVSTLTVPATVDLAGLPLDLSALFPQGINASSGGFHPLRAGEKALFGEANYDMFWKLRLTLGARLYQAKVEGTAVTSGASAANGFRGDQNEKGFSPKLALTWKPTRDLMAYANVTRGFQFGGFNVVQIPDPSEPVPTSFSSSTLWNYETGIRTDWFHRTFRLDLTGFFLDWSHAQVSQVTGDGTGTFVSNVGKVHSEGFETTLRYLTPISGLSIEEAASYIRARTAVPFTDSVGAIVPTGSEMPSSPIVQSTVTLSYKHPFGNWTTQSQLIDSYQGVAWNDIAHDDEVGGYNTLNMNFSVSRGDLSFAPTLTFTANNVLDRRAIVSELGGGPLIASQPTLSNDITPIPTVYNRPRSFGLRLSMDF
jgi:outer membrane receptor protein involved in Fe transport